MQTYTVTVTASSPPSVPVVTGGNGGNSLQPQIIKPPSSPPSGFSMSINQGATMTGNRDVSLSFNAGQDISKMAISMLPELSDAGQQPYQSQLKWNLCPLNSICPDKTYTVYAKLYTQYGQSSPIISDSITLKTGSQPLPISSNPTTSSSTVTFTQLLKYGSNNHQVVLLQNLLKKLGFLSKSITSNGNFGPATLKAVQSFQIKYHIAKSGIIGYGQVGPNTRKKLNGLNR